MKNIVVILCDSLSYEEHFFDDMPHLSKRKDNFINFSNYFSQAPYTEAAIIPIFTASNVLDHDGYFNTLRDRPLNINETFSSFGYKTYNSLWFYPNTLSMLRGVDEYDYADNVSLTYHVTAYRINYFMDLYARGKLLDDHMKMVGVLLEDFFKMAEIYVEDYNHRKYRFDLLMQYTDFGAYCFEDFEYTMEENQRRFLRNKEAYITELLAKGNPFFNDGFFRIKRSQVFRRHYAKMNYLTYKLMSKQFLYGLINTSSNHSLQRLNYTLRNLNNKDVTFNSIKRWVYYTINYRGYYKYETLSAKVFLDRVCDYLLKNRDQKNFIMCHIMDTHTPFNFISSEFEKNEHEFEDFFEMAKNFDKYSNNFYRYSKRYIDNQIHHLINRLEMNDLMDDTAIILTSDHGSSYLGRIYRNEIVSTFYDENYRIPLIIYSNEIKGREIDNLAISTQFLPTILDCLDISNDANWVRENSALQHSRDSVIFEYFGSGCPDYFQKEKLFCVRNDKFKIQYRWNSRLNHGEITAIYDLCNDPNELVDIREKIGSNDEVAYLLGLLKDRLGS